MSLKKQRRACGLSQHQCARLASVAVSRLSYAESGRTRLTADEIQRIRQVLTKRVEKLAAAVA